MKMEYTQAARVEDQDSFHGGQRKKKMKNKRFSDEQIRSLESRFEKETKLEPQKKVQLAKDLGLQPRQVAIWFQNKRARWKAKQLERQFNDLKANYDALASKFESLKEEKLCLLKQLQKLGDLIEIEKQPEENRCCGSGSISNSGCDRSENKKDTNCSEYDQRRLLDKEPDVTVIVYKDGRNGENQGFECKQQELHSMGETLDGSLLPEWSGFDSEYFSDQSCSSLQWWDLWHN